MNIVFEGELIFRTEDSGCSKYASLSNSDSKDYDDRLYVEIGSYDDVYEDYIRGGGDSENLTAIREYRTINSNYKPEHPLVNNLQGKKVKVTIEVIE
jgi:hypothetical protein